MSDKVNEQELVNVLSAKTKVDPQIIRLVLKHEQTFINKVQGERQG